MAQIPGTNVAARVVPFDDADTYASHDAKYGRDGWRSVVDIAERDAITEQRRKEGMVVWVKADGKTYQLVGGIDNIHWVELSIGGGGGGGLDLAALTEILCLVLDIDDNKPVFDLDDSQLVHDLGCVS